MDTLPIKRKKLRRRSNAPQNSSPLLFLPEELLAEILPFFNVQTITRLKCLSKSWFAFISDSNFALKHLEKSTQNPYLTLFCYQRDSSNFNVLLYPVHCILKNPSINFSNSPDIQPIHYHCQFVGSCNGLLCLRNYSIRFHGGIEFCLWNPATSKESEKFGLMPYYNLDLGYFDNFTFGYDVSTRAYKVVAFCAIENEGSWKSEVKVFNVGDCYWRNIQSFPVVPSTCFDYYYNRQRLADGVHFSGTINWFSVENSIVSLYLSTETYKQFPLPPGFDEVPFFQPLLRVLMDRFCFSCDCYKTEFVLWQMKEYGVEESWTQLFKISYQNIQTYNIDGEFQLACLYANGDKVIFAKKSRKSRRDLAFIYNLKDKTSERIKCKTTYSGSTTQKIMQKVWFQLVERRRYTNHSWLLDDGLDIQLDYFL